MSRAVETLLVVIFLGTAGVFGLLGVMGIPILPSKPSLEPVDVPAATLLEPRRLVLGTSGASEKIVMFGDYQCPPCRQEWPQIVKAFKGKGGRLAVYFVQFPLTEIHEYAFAAAVASEVAQDSGAFSKMHQTLYSTEPSDGWVESAYKTTGLALPDDSHKLIQDKHRLADDISLGQQLKVTSTPTLMYIDDQNKVYDLPSLEDLP